MFNLDNCVAFVTNIASKTLSESLNNRLMKHDVTKSQWIAMYYINREDFLTQKDLAELMGASQPTITGVLDRLEKQSFIERKEHDQDKRKKVIVLTDKGKEINKKLTHIAEDFKDACLEDVDKKDQDTFLNILDKMVASAIKWDDETKELENKN